MVKRTDCWHSTWQTGRSSTNVDIDSACGETRTMLGSATWHSTDCNTAILLQHSPQTCRGRQREHAGDFGECLRQCGLCGATPRHRCPGVQPLAHVGGGARPPRAGHLHCAARTAWSSNTHRNIPRSVLIDSAGNVGSPARNARCGDDAKTSTAKRMPWLDGEFCTPLRGYSAVLAEPPGHWRRVGYHRGKSLPILYPSELQSATSAALSDKTYYD